MVQKIGYFEKSEKNSKLCFSRNSHLKMHVSKFNFDNYCYCKFKARSLKKDILSRICPIELKFSGFVVLSKFYGINIELSKLCIKYVWCFLYQI